MDLLTTYQDIFTTTIFSYRVPQNGFRESLVWLRTKICFLIGTGTKEIYLFNYKYCNSVNYLPTNSLFVVNMFEIKIM